MAFKTVNLNIGLSNSYLTNIYQDPFLKNRFSENK